VPNRTLKESICTSESLAAVSAEAERLFYRLLVNCDDFGRFHGNPKVIRAECFPLRIEDFPVETVKAWLGELERVGMVRFYTTGKRAYLEVVSWREHNTPRANKSKYPSPDDCAAMNLQTSANICAQTSTNALVHDTVHDTEHDTEVGRARDAQPATTLDDMNPLEDEVANLQNWGAFGMDDRAWLESTTKDYPSVLPADIRDMGVWWYAKAEKDRKVKHSKAQWKTRLRNWLRHKVEGGKDGQVRGSPRAIPGNAPSGAFSRFEAQFEDRDGDVH
jgi:hypothetical protein